MLEVDRNFCGPPPGNFHQLEKRQPKEYHETNYIVFSSKQRRLETYRDNRRATLTRLLVNVL